MERTVIGNIGVQALSERIIRIELKANGDFCDADTFFIPDRGAFPGAECKRVGNTVTVGEYTLSVPDGNSPEGITLSRDGEVVYTYKKLKNTGELPPLGKAPEVFAIVDSPRILPPKHGYSYSEGDCGYVIQHGVTDIYLLVAEGSDKLLRRLYVELTGRSELVRLSTLGLWDSKYYAYNEETAKQRILDYEAHDIPLDNIVIDTDWRAASDRGIGYDVDTALFPDMPRFFRFAHDHGVDVMFNDHPEPVEGAKSCLDPIEIRYREEKLLSLFKMGLDTWWYDRNWHTKLISPVKGVLPETLGLYLFQDVTKHHYQAQSSDEVYRRPDIMGNVNNIYNGRYKGRGKYKINDSASHRYSIQWSGDIASDARALSAEVHNLIDVGNNCIPYINFDCGGHIGNPDEDMYIRWMQFGALSPILRPHCTKMVVRTREPWAYGADSERIVREFILLRYRLMQVIYKNAYNSYVTGEPIFKSLGYEYPTDRRALREKNSYMLGNDLLISPVNDGLKNKYAVPEANFTAPVTATYFDGREWQGKPLYVTQYKTLSKYWDHVAPHKGVPIYDFSARYETKIKFDTDMELSVESDDGVTVWIDGKLVIDDKSMHAAVVSPLGRVSGGVEHDIRIDYFQAGGEACIALLCNAPKSTDSKSVYLPEGRWLDAFSGRVHDGCRTVKRKYAIDETALFVRLGAVVPLCYNDGNTKKQRKDKLVLDFYPDKPATDSGYIYADDGETTAYKKGENAVTPFDSGFDAKTGAYFIRIGKTEGHFSGDSRIAERDITVKAHMLFAGAVKKVTVDGKDTPFTLNKKCSAFPLSTEDGARDSDTVTFRLTAAAKNSTEILIYTE